MFRGLNNRSSFLGGKLDVMKPDLLRGIAVFTEVARLKSVSRAAAALEMPKSTVSRRRASHSLKIGGLWSQTVSHCATSCASSLLADFGLVPTTSSSFFS